MKHAENTLRTSPFLNKLICTRTILDNVEVVGVLMLHDNELKYRCGGQTDLLKTFGIEQKRVDALKEWFGIFLTDEEERGIEGLVTELKPTWQQTLPT